MSPHCNQENIWKDDIPGKPFLFQKEYQASYKNSVMDVIFSSTISKFQIIPLPKSLNEKKRKTKHCKRRNGKSRRVVIMA